MRRERLILTATLCACERDWLSAFPNGASMFTVPCPPLCASVPLGRLGYSVDNEVFAQPFNMLRAVIGCVVLSMVDCPHTLKIVERIVKRVAVNVMYFVSVGYWPVRRFPYLLMKATDPGPPIYRIWRVVTAICPVLGVWIPIELNPAEDDGIAS